MTKQELGQVSVMRDGNEHYSLYPFHALLHTLHNSSTRTQKNTPKMTIQNRIWCSPQSACWTCDFPACITHLTAFINEDKNHQQNVKSFCEL